MCIPLYWTSEIMGDMPWTFFFLPFSLSWIIYLLSLLQWWPFLWRSWNCLNLVSFWQNLIFHKNLKLLPLMLKIFLFYSVLALYGPFEFFVGSDLVELVRKFSYFSKMCFKFFMLSSTYHCLFMNSFGFQDLCYDIHVDIKNWFLIQSWL